MKVLVSGGGGFIGQRVVSEAQRAGHDVRILTRASAGTTSTATRDVQIIAHDLRQSDGLVAALRGIDAVIHCAAAMGGSLAEQRAVTVDGTRNLLTAMKEAGVYHVIGVSTFAIYDFLGIPTGSLLTEESPLVRQVDPRDAYVLTKREQEEHIRRAGQEYGWRWTIIRPGIVYGPGRLWSYHLGAKISPSRWVCFAGRSPVPLTNVEHCADAIVRALSSDAAHGASINIVDDDPPTRREFVDLLARHEPTRPKVSDVPWWLLERAAALADVTTRSVLLGRVRLPDVLRPESIHARCKPLRYSNDAAKRLLGWTPRWSLEQGVARSI